MLPGLILGAVLGGIWGLVVVTVVGVSMTIVLGLSTTLTAIAALFAGVIGGLVWLIISHRALMIRALLSWIMYVLVFSLLTNFSPLGVPLSQQPLSGLIVLVVLGALNIGAVGLAFRQRDWRHLNRYRFEEVVMRALKGLGFVVFTIIVLLPFYAMLMTSFKNQSDLLSNPLDYSIDLSQGLRSLFRSYIELFTTFSFGRYILISTLVSCLTVVFTLLASIPGAYAISRLYFPGRRVFSRSILMIYMVPAIVLVIPLYAVFSQLGLRDNLLGLLIVYPATTIPVALYMLQGYFRGLPAELEEAGLMDGCSRLGVIYRITLPLSVPAIASVALYVFMIAWNEFLFAFMFLDTPEIFTLSRAVVSLNSSEIPRQHLMAGAVIVTVPVVLLFLWFERFFVTGLTGGAVKG